MRKRAWCMTTLGCSLADAQRRNQAGTAKWNAVTHDSGRHAR